MSAPWHEEDEESRMGGARGALKAKPRFSFTEVKVLLEAVKRNRYILLRKFNQGVSAEMKKQTWAEITRQINGLGENHREVRQIMKKWADLKCDGKRRIIALRGQNGSNVRKKYLGPVEKMVHKILMMNPKGDGESEPEFDEDDFSKLYSKEQHSDPSYSYLNVNDGSYSLPGGLSFDMSPLSSPEKEPGSDPFHSSSDFDLDLADDGDLPEPPMDFGENEDSLFSCYSSSLPLPSSTSLDPLPDNAMLRVKPVHTYSRNNNQNHNSAKPPPGPSSSVASTSSVFPSVSDADPSSLSAAPPPVPTPTSSHMTPSSVPAPSSSSSSSSLALPPAASSKSDADNDSTSPPAPSTSSIPPPPPPPPAPPASSAVASSSSAAPAVASSSSSTPPSSISHQPPPSPSVIPPNHPSTSGSCPADPLPAGASSRRTHDHVSQMASQSLQQQRAGRLLLTSVSQSLEMLAQSVQLLVESQQEFVQESLLLQRETVDILRDFSNTALTMLRDKANSGQMAAHHHPASRF